MWRLLFTAALLGAARAGQWSGRYRAVASTSVDGSHRMDGVLEGEDGRHRLLRLPTADTLFANGHAVTVTGTPTADGSAILVERILLLPAALRPHATFYNGTLTHIIVTLPDTPESWVRGVNDSANAVLADLSAVSMGAVRLRSAVHRLALDAVPDECDWQGITAGAVADGPLPSDGLIATTMPRALGIRPDGEDTCTFAGKVFSGIAFIGGRFSWTRSSQGDIAARHRHVMFHELGHNFGLYHANRGGVEYGDDTCSMGTARTLRTGNTLNGAMLAALGWATAEHAAVGTYDLPCLGTTNRVLQYGEDTYISYRCSAGHDAVVAPADRDRMYVHRLGANKASSLLFSGTAWRDERGRREVVVQSAGDSQYVVVAASGLHIDPLIVFGLGALASAAICLRTQYALRRNGDPAIKPQARLQTQRIAVPNFGAALP
jgi:hypothetical protein